jgi:hypothetical protein
MNNASTLITLISSAVPAAPMVTTPMDSVVALVQIVKKYEEDGCETFIRD